MGAFSSSCLGTKRKATAVEGNGVSDSDTTSGSETKIKVVKFTTYYFSRKGGSEKEDHMKKQELHEPSGRSGHRQYQEDIKKVLTLIDAENRGESAPTSDNFDFERGTWAWGCAYCGGLIEPCICVSNKN